MAEIMNDLREEHRGMARLFGILEGQLELFQASETPDYDLINEAIDLLFHYPHRYHHPKEDAVFEKLARRDPAAARDLPDLGAEHEKLRDLTQRFAANIEDVLSEVEKPRDEVVKGLRELAEFQRRHMHMEESVFFPAALKSLTAEDWAELDARADDPDDSAFGATAKKELAERLAKILPGVE